MNIFNVHSLHEPIKTDEKKAQVCQGPPHFIKPIHSSKNNYKLYNITPPRHPVKFKNLFVRATGELTCPLNRTFSSKNIVLIDLRRTHIIELYRLRRMSLGRL
jgi:hypothetical protein